MEFKDATGKAITEDEFLAGLKLNSASFGMLGHVVRLDTPEHAAAAAARMASRKTPPHFPPRNDAELRSSYDIADGEKLVFRAEDGTSITEQKFISALANNVSFAVSGNQADITEFTLEASVAQRGKVAALAPGDPMPPFNLKSTTNQVVTQSDFKGKPTVVDFFFSGCGGCVQAIPVLNEFKRQRPDVRTLAMTFDGSDLAADFVHRHGLNWPTVSGAIGYADSLGIIGSPSLALVSADGKLLATTIEPSLAKPGQRVTAADISAWVDANTRDNHRSL
jgi:thiol-disulfide isomerase/thioredoxin